LTIGSILEGVKGAKEVRRRVGQETLNPSRANLPAMKMPSLGYIYKFKGWNKNLGK
jgi:hypothetical protein